MKSIFTYLDYRRYLRDFYEDQKSVDSFISYRYIAGKVGLDHGYIIKLLQDNTQISKIKRSFSLILEGI